MEMYYNGFLLTQLINITEVKRPVIGERILNSISVNGRNGEIFQGSTFGTKTIEVSFYMKYDHIPDAPNDSSLFQKVVTSLAFYLTGNKEPAPLIFSDQPNLYYLAIVENIDLERLLRIGQGSITFKCFSPYLYSLNSYEFNASNGIVTIVNDATASCYPVFRTTLSQATKYLMYVSTNGVIQVGSPNEAETGDTPRNDIIHSDNCASTAKWYAGSSSLLLSDRQVDSNVSVVSTGQSLKLSANPTGEANDGKYHGAWIMTTLDGQADYWQCKFYFKMKSQPSFNTEGSSPRQKGMIEMVMYDANNVPLNRFTMRDYYYDHEFNIPIWYDGKGKELWRDAEITGNQTTTITDNVKSLSELPSNATILSKSQFTIYKAVVKWNGTPIYKTKNESGDIYYKTGTGTSFIIASNDATWCRIYLDSTKTTTGFILMKHVNKVEDHKEYLVTYTKPVTTGTGKWDDFSGCVIIERRKHSSNVGCMWNMYLYKKKGNDSFNGDIELRKTVELYDSSNSFTTGGKIAKVGVYLACYQSAEPPQLMTFDDIIVKELLSDSQLAEQEQTGFSYIGNAGDVITVDCGEQMVYNNGEPIMEFVDVGSEFFDIDAFSSSQVKIVSDDSGATTTASITKRYL